VKNVLFKALFSSSPDQGDWRGLEGIRGDFDLGLVWMYMYSSQSTCVKVDWNGIKLNSISFHSNTCGLRWIHVHPNNAL
jgi:hypothetical protein